jgi:hypothetical protein
MVLNPPDDTPLPDSHRQKQNRLGDLDGVINRPAFTNHQPPDQAPPVMTTLLLRVRQGFEAEAARSQPVGRLRSGASARTGERMRCALG